MSVWLVRLTDSGCFVREDGKIPQNRAGKRFYVTALEARLQRTLRKGFCACHTCDNRPCVNPDHLFEGTKGDNARDSIKKGRFAFINLIRARQYQLNRTHCKRGHEWTPANTYRRPNGSRLCRVCVTELKERR